MSGLELFAAPTMWGFSEAGVAALEGAGYAGITAGATEVAAGGALGWMSGVAEYMPSMAQLGVAGNIVSAGSLFMGGLAQGNAANSNSKAGELAALQTEDAAARNAFALERKNKIEADNLSQAQQQAKARRAVAWGKSGTAMAGSPIAVEAGAAWQDEFNLTQMQQTGALEVSNVYYDAAGRASKLRTQAALDSYMGGTYKVGGALSAGGTLLTAGAKKYGGSIYGG